MKFFLCIFGLVFITACGGGAASNSSPNSVSTNSNANQNVVNALVVTAVFTTLPN